MEETAPSIIGGEILSCIFVDGLLLMKWITVFVGRICKALVGELENGMELNAYCL